MCALARFQLGLAAKTQVSQGPPIWGLSAYFAPIFFSASLFNNPLIPSPTPSTPTHSYTDTGSRVMFPDLHVLSLRKYSFGNQRLRKCSEGNQE